MNQIVSKISSYLLQAGVDKSFVEDSVWRIENNFFEQRHAYLAKGEIALIVGGAKNLVLAILLAKVFPFAKVIIIETHSGLQKMAMEVCESLGIYNLHFMSLLEQIAGVIGENVVGWCLIDLDADFDLSSLKAIFSQITIRQIAGEVNNVRISEASIRLFLAKKVERYYFRIYGSNRVVSGKGRLSRTNDDTPDISVIVPVYNSEKYLSYCLASLVQSDDLDKEILIINDGSTDDSESIAREFEKSYPNVFVISKSNGGCASARSEGLRHARGEYVGFVDSDDWVDRGMFEDLYESALTYQSDIVYSGFRAVFESRNQTKSMVENVQCTDGNCDGVVKVLDQLYSLQPSIWRAIYRRSFLEAYRLDFPHQIQMFDDLYFTFVTLCNAKRVSFVPRTYYNYRLGQVNQDVASNDERLYIHFDIFNLLREYVREVGDEKLEWRLKLVELNTHKWGYGKIIPDLRKTYLMKAATNFSETVYVWRYWVPFYAYRYFGFDHARFAALLTLLARHD